MSKVNDNLNEQGPGSLTLEQEQAILALLSEPTVSRAATTAKVSERSLYRWLSEPAFSRAYREARRESFRHAIALTQRYAPMAVQALVKIMADGKSADSAKVAAATAMLKFSRESIELDDLAARLEVLEQASSQLGTPRLKGAA